jgi:hypothetical protein
MGNPHEAAELYRTSKELWPETIETTYRLAAAYANGNRYALANQALDEIRGRLQLIALYWAWIRTWRPTHWNIGERRYWASWIFRNPVIFGVSKRKVYLRAAEIAKLARKMEALARGDQNQQETPIALLKKVTNCTTRTRTWTVYARQFHPDVKLAERFSRRHLYSWHEADSADFNMDPAIKVRLKRRIGWLAHYNAAIFFSFAIGLKSGLPQEYDIAFWRMDCARAAIRELGHVKRDPKNELEPDWYRRDPGLKFLRVYMREFGPRWSEFVGLAAPTDDTVPLESISATVNSITEARDLSAVDGTSGDD